MPLRRYLDAETQTAELSSTHEDQTRSTVREKVDSILRLMHDYKWNISYIPPPSCYNHGQMFLKPRIFNIAENRCASKQWANEYVCITAVFHKLDSLLSSLMSASKSRERPPIWSIFQRLFFCHIVRRNENNRRSIPPENGNSVYDKAFWKVRWCSKDEITAVVYEFADGSHLCILCVKTSTIYN